MRSLLRHGPRTLLTLLPVLLALLHASGVWRMPVLERLEAIAYDIRLRAFMPRTLDERIVIVDIDEKSLAEVGRWPWPRDRMADLVNRLFDQQRVAVLGMDVVFAEPDESSGLQRLEALAQGPLRSQPGFAAELQRLRPTLDHDGLFAQALKDRPVVLGYYFTSDRQARRSGALPAPVMEPSALQGRAIRFTQWDGFGSNLPVLAQAAPIAGFFNPVVDADGVVRSLPLLVEHEGRYYESLALAVFRQLIGLPTVEPGLATHDPAYPHLTSVRLTQDGRGMDLPVDANVATLVPFRGPGGPQGGSFGYVSASDVLLGRLGPAALQDKVVLLGTTAPGLLDMRATPVDVVYPGVETHANVLSAMLDDRPLTRPDYAVGFELALIALSGVLLALALPLLTATSAVLLSAGVAAAVVGLNVWLYTAAGLVLPVATTLLMVALAFAVNMSYGYLIESRSKRQLADLFGSYVPPELVDEMVKSPEDYSMRAQVRELTVMFSDMRGFTQLSETMKDDPQGLQTLLNGVFSRLTQAIRSRRGTIDKYMGDCVMAFWGAPVGSSGHAQDAVQAALDMRQAMRAINAEHRSRGQPDIGMGVGLNSGPMCVGDMGSDIRRSYTVIGDAVNLGSRLEGLSKHYGVDIVASASTRDQTQGVVWRELDKVKVKGKDEPVTIHTPIGLDADVSAAQRTELDHWHTALAAYRRCDWDTAEQALATLQQAATAATPDHGASAHAPVALYHLYLERIAQLRQHPPAADWDGSFAFDTK